VAAIRYTSGDNLGPVTVWWFCRPDCIFSVNYKTCQVFGTYRWRWKNE